MSFFEIIKAFIPLVLIIGLLYGVLLFVKKYGISIKGKRSSLVAINVISSHMIMPKKFISIVKVEDKLLILGISEHSITLLKEIEPPTKPVDEQIYDDEKNNFIAVLKKNLGLK